MLPQLCLDTALRCASFRCEPHSYRQLLAAADTSLSSRTLSLDFSASLSSTAVRCARASHLSLSPHGFLFFLPRCRNRSVKAAALRRRPLSHSAACTSPAPRCRYFFFFFFFFFLLFLFLVFGLSDLSGVFVGALAPEFADLLTFTSVTSACTSPRSLAPFTLQHESSITIHTALIVDPSSSLHLLPL